jgi:hypothetical protein
MKINPLTLAVRELRRRGWRVRRGGWPSTLACESRWDFAYITPGRSSDGAYYIFSITPEAREALNSVMGDQGYGRRS